MLMPLAIVNRTYSTLLVMFFQSGVAGPFWYGVGIIFNIFIFPIFSVQFKTRAPGAKTYLQVKAKKNTPK